MKRRQRRFRRLSADARQIKPARILHQPHLYWVNDRKWIVYKNVITTYLVSAFDCSPRQMLIQTCSSGESIPSCVCSERDLPLRSVPHRGEERTHPNTWSEKIKPHKLLFIACQEINFYYPCLSHQLKWAPDVRHARATGWDWNIYNIRGQPLCKKYLKFIEINFSDIPMLASMTLQGTWDNKKVFDEFLFCVV
jgi:hypothetical protein